MSIPCRPQRAVPWPLPDAYAGRLLGRHQAPPWPLPDSSLGAAAGRRLLLCLLLSLSLSCYLASLKNNLWASSSTGLASTAVSQQVYPI